MHTNLKIFLTTFICLFVDVVCKILYQNIIFVRCSFCMAADRAPLKSTTSTSSDMTYNVFGGTLNLALSI